jgi:hypothetical protein
MPMPMQSLMANVTISPGAKGVIELTFRAVSAGGRGPKQICIRAMSAREQPGLALMGAEHAGRSRRQMPVMMVSRIRRPLGG